MKNMGAFTACDGDNAAMNFVPPDIQIFYATMYLIEDGKLRMPLMAVAGRRKAANSVVEARKDGPLFTIEDVNRHYKAQQHQHCKG